MRLKLVQVVHLERIDRLSVLGLPTPQKLQEFQVRGWSRFRRRGLGQRDNQQQPYHQPFQVRRPHPAAPVSANQP
jgi:hypothetical protein